MSKIPALTFYEYAAQHGWHRFEGVFQQPLKADEFGPYPRWDFDVIDARRARETDNWLKRRSELYNQYVDLVSTGKLRHPTRKEMLMAAAHGHPDNQSTQAARRVLRKMSRAARANAICCSS